MDAKSFYDSRAVDYDSRHETFRARHLRNVEKRTITRFSGGAVLDMGCGAGEHLGNSMIGLDVSAGMLTEAKKKGFGNLVQGRVEELPFRDGMFDTALCMFTVMNLCDHQRAVSEMRRVLKKGGVAIVSASSVWDHSPKSLLRRLVTNKRSQILRMRIHKFRFEFFAFSKGDLIDLFSGFRLKHFYGAYMLANAYWGWKRDFSLKERVLLRAAFALERLLQPLSRAARMYVAVFEKR